MTDKKRIINIITKYSPLLCEGEYLRFTQSINDNRIWNYSIIGLSKLSELINLHNYLRTMLHDKQNPIQEEPVKEGPAADKIEKEVTAKGKLEYQIRCWDDKYEIKHNNNVFSQLVAFEIVFQSISKAVEAELKRLENGANITDGMTKTLFNKHRDMLQLLEGYKHEQLLELRKQMVSAQKNKVKKTPKKKSNIVIAPANAPLPPMKQ